MRYVILFWMCAILIQIIQCLYLEWDYRKWTRENNESITKR